MSTFSDLPAALVQEVIARARELGDELVKTFQSLHTGQQEYRKSLEREKLIRVDSELAYAAPTTCGVDGAFAAERLLVFDLVAATAVAVEGLTPPSEKRFWPEPRHFAHVAAERHDADNTVVMRALMLGMEYVLACEAPHDVVMLDGSMTTGAIYLNQALSAIATEEAIPTSTTNTFMERIDNILASYLTILKSQRSDKQYIAVPKYTTRREIGARLKWPEEYDDRLMLTKLLKPGEYTTPIEMDQPARPWHINNNLLGNDAKSLVREIEYQLSQVHIVYYCPRPFLPAIRFEVSRSVASNEARLASVIYALKQQSTSPNIFEPFPLYMADRMAKALGDAMPTFRQVLTQQIAESYNGSVSDVFIDLHSYRTESGR